jgi:pyruvate formate lyase activating enzyme
MVTAGYIQPGPLKQVLPLIDAVTIGLKGWNQDFYTKFIGGDLKHVKQTIRILAETKDVWWEVVNLIVPSLNDKMNEIAAMAAWLRETAGPERPLHFTRFRPMYRLKQLDQTPPATLEKARETALKQGLKHVYVGNLPGHPGANTYCCSCGKTVIERIGFTVLNQHIKQGNCGFCGKRLGGVWL